MTTKSDYFISDVHLGFFPRDKEKEREAMLIGLLRKISSDCRTLYIIGDLFDYWFEYRTVIPKDFIRTLSELIRLRENGVEIEYLMGNHDFGHKDYFEMELDIRIHHQDIERTIDGKKFFLSHGDGKVQKDKGYLILKKILRHKLSNSIYRFVHPDLGIRMASSSSKTSRGYTDNKNYGMGDSLFDFAKEKINEGYDYVIMGHRHKLFFEKIGEGYYINLGEWFNNPSFGRFDGKKFELINVREFIGK